MTDFLGSKLCTITGRNEEISRMYAEVSELSGFILKNTRGGGNIKSIQSNNLRELVVLKKVFMPEKVSFKGRKFDSEGSMIVQLRKILSKLSTGKILLRKVAGTFQMLHFHDNLENFRHGSLLNIQHDLIFCQKLNGYMLSKALMNFIPDGKTANRVIMFENCPDKVSRTKLGNDSFEKIAVYTRYQLIYFNTEKEEAFLIDKSGIDMKILYRQGLMI